MSSPEPLEKKSFYLPELDVLRAGAFLAVFTSHWIPQERDFYADHGVPAVVSRAAVGLAAAGGTGVMLFFCLSSYLITQLLLQELASRGHVDVRAFYMRRILRIWPLYLTFTFIAALMPFVDPKEHFGWKPVAAFLFFGGNWIWALNVPVSTIALPLWSISVEEQFYLCWPWVVRRATRKRLRNIVFGLFVLAAINRVLVVTGVLHVDLWHNTFTQLDAIGLGALLAIGVGPRLDPTHVDSTAWSEATMSGDAALPRRNGSTQGGVGLEELKARWRGPLIACALLGIYLVNLAHLDVAETARINLFYYPFVSLCCALILFATIGVKLDLGSPLVRALVYLGKISFGLYVVHFACFYAVNALYHLLPKKPHFLIAFFGRGLCAMTLAIAIASLSYRYLEQPFLRLKTKFARTPATEATLPAPLTQIS